ncbi:MAG: serine/threonine-protein kinase [Acidobacteriota bacterium]
MTPEQWQRVKDIFENAAEIGDPAERLTFVRRECAGDESLLKEVQELLACHDVSGAPIEKAAQRGIEELRREMAVRPDVSLTGARLSSDGRPPESLEGSRVGSIRLDALIGIGGMGEVYRGFDEKLQRTVAVKTIRAERRLSAESKARFLREARTLSKLNHPSICQAYDLIEAPDADYLVLEFVEGRTLRGESVQQLPLAQKLRISIEIAEALSAAHEADVVHRDLKPDNVMVTNRGAVKILDFGIARSVSRNGGIEKRVNGAQECSPFLLAAAPAAGSQATSEGTTEPLGRDEQAKRDGTMNTAAGLGTRTTLTRAGSALGTLRYMSPEQIKGDPVTPACDMFSFGLFLQEIFTGKPAYPDDLPIEELLDRVRAGRTGPIGEIDPDLALLIRKLTALRAIERPTAREAVSQLRWVQEKPARRRRRRLRIAAGAAFAAVLLAAGIAVFVSRIRAARHVEIARHFGEEARDVEWLMRAEYLSPAHDIRPGKNEVRRRMKSLEASMAEIGGLAAGPGHAALGRGALALGDFRAARSHLEAAVREDYHTPEVSYALGTALGELYKSEISAIRMSRSPELRVMDEKRAARELREPALAELRRSRGGSLTFPELINGQIALFERRWDEAITLADAAAKKSRWLYEAPLLKATVHFEKGYTALFDENDARRATQEFAVALAAGHDAASIGRSCPVVHDTLCRIRSLMLRAQVVLREARPSQHEMGEAAGECACAIGLDPESATSLRVASELLSWQAAAIWPDDAAEGLCQEALEKADRAVALQPDDPSNYIMRSALLARLAEFAFMRSRDAIPPQEMAIEDMRRARELAPEWMLTYVNLGERLYSRGLIAWWRGEDPLPWLHEAVDRLEEAHKRYPAGRAIASRLGTTYIVKGRYEAEHGLDAARSLSRAVELLHQVSETGQAEDLRNESLALIDLGNYKLDRGEDPSVQFTQAVARLSKAIVPAYGLPEFAEGLAHFGLARYAYMTGRDPGKRIAQAADSYRRGLAKSSENMEARPELAEILALQARFDLRSNRSPKMPLGEARRVLDEGQRLFPNSNSGLRVEALLDLLEAQWKVSLGRPPESDFSRAVRRVEQAVQEKKEAAHSRLLAEIYLRWAEWKIQESNDAGNEIANGLDAAVASLAINAASGEAEAIRGSLLLLKSRGAGAEAKVAYEQSQQAFDSAFKLNPLLRNLYGKQNRLAQRQR